MPTQIHAAGPNGQRSPGLDAAIAGYLAEHPPSSGGGGASALDDLTDVDTTGQTTGDVLKFNGTTWVADAASAGTVTSTDISDSSAVGRSVLTATNAAAARTAIGAGTSSFSGAYADLSGKPTLGTAAATAATDYATAAQGGKADSALQVGTPVPIVTLSGAQTTGATHAGKDLHITASSGVDLTVQTAPAGSVIQVRQSGAGALTCVGDGVTLTPMPGMTLVSGGLGARFAIVYTSSSAADVLGWMVAA